MWYGRYESVYCIERTTFLQVINVINDYCNFSSEMKIGPWKVPGQNLMFVPVVRWVPGQSYRLPRWSRRRCMRYLIYLSVKLPSVIWRCWLSSSKAIPPVIIERKLFKQGIQEATIICLRSLQVDLWPFDLESGVRVACDVCYLSVLDLGPMYATDRRQTDRCQTRIIAWCPLP